MTIPGGLVSVFGVGGSFDTGWVFPASTQQPAGTGIVWSNTDNVFADDGTYASVSLSDAEVSRRLRAYNFGLSIPGASTIVGIEIRAEMSSSDISGIRWSEAYVTPGETATGTDGISGSGGSLPTSDTVITYGSPTDLWGQSWTAAQINSSDFSVQVKCSAAFPPPGAGAFCDFIQVKVYYEY